MNHHRLSHVFLVVAMILAAAIPNRADTRWSRVAPDGAGFSIEAPGERMPAKEAGEYDYNVGLWFLSVKLMPVDPGVRHLLESRDRRAIRTRLESMRDGIAATVKATTARSSFGEVDGYPTIRFSLEFDELEGTNLIVLTGDQMYMVITVGPKGGSDDNAKRFLRSFRLTTNAAE